MSQHSGHINLNVLFFVSDSTELTVDHRVIPTINAVYSLAEGVHRTLQMKCGINYTGVCPDFFSDETTYDLIMSNMDQMSFKDIKDNVFRFIEREADRQLIFSQFQTNGDVTQVSNTYSVIVLLYYYLL